MTATKFANIFVLTCMFVYLYYFPMSFHFCRGLKTDCSHLVPIKKFYRYILAILEKSFIIFKPLPIITAGHHPRRITASLVFLHQLVIRKTPYHGSV